MTIVADTKQTAERAAAQFRACYRAEPQGVWHAPGRANLIGEHTDYNEGWVLPFALDTGVVVAAARRDDGVLEMSSRQAPGEKIAEPAGALSPGVVKGWAAYPAGVAWSLRAARHQVSGARVAIDSDLPQGAGLSSSAALECAVALALVDLYGLTVPRRDLAAIAQRAENDFVGVPCGIMDQSASLLCEAGHALLLDCRTGDTESVPLNLAASGAALLLVDTRARHTLADGSYSLRRQQCEQAARALGVRSLRDISDMSRVRLADPVLRRRARHVITENRRVLDAARMLRTGDMAGAGRLLHGSHSSLRDDFEVSWPEADVAVEAAERAGALGARMMGGGFGGSVIVLVPGGGDAAVRSAIIEAYARQGWQTPMFLSARPSPGAHRMR